MPVVACPPQPSAVTYLVVRSAIDAPFSISGGGRSCDGFSGAFNPQRYVSRSRTYPPRPAPPARLRIDQRVLPGAPTWANPWHWALRVAGARRQFTALDLRAVNAGGWVLQVRAAGGNWVSSAPIRSGPYAAPRGAVVIGTVGGRRVQARPVGGVSPAGRLSLTLLYA
jgi:hypothetical protein